MRVCSQPDCPNLIPEAGRCPTHARQADQARGTRQQRGYTAEHDQQRRAWQPRVARGDVNCWRCGNQIKSTDRWHLGHDDDDRRIWRGPEHARCNLSAAGRASHQK